MTEENGQEGVVSEPKLARQGFNLLLEHYPDALPNKMENTGPWLCVDLDNEQRFAIWMYTGNVYRVSGDILGGEVEDDPFLIVTPL